MKDKSIIILYSILILLFSLNINAQILSGKELVKLEQEKIHQIEVEQFVQKIEKGESPILIDIRTEKEYLAGHIKNAIWISRGKLEFLIQKYAKNANDEIIVYCKSGNRATLAASSLANLGYKNILNLKGGFKEWVKSGHPYYNLHGESRLLNFGKGEN